ncbi:MAG: class I SAM-dependent methyltransferase [Actinobacteria bacterium]|nr:class I SAM-dependent methyltransferase [Actinomycetota bacterium]
MPLEPLAERGFGTRAEEYELARPGWPGEVVDALARELDVGRESTVVDLAAGTGKLTRELVPRAGRVVAVEPSEAMRRQLAALVPGAQALDGTAEAIPLADASADAVFVAEAFHWFATQPAVAEIARVLRPGGGLALLWNVHQWGGDDPGIRPVGELIGSRRAGGATREERYQSGAWREPFDRCGLFEPLREVEVRHEQVTDLDGLLLHISTWSFVAALDEPEREALLADARTILERELPDPGRVVIPYRTDAHWTRRLPQPSTG